MVPDAANGFSAMHILAHLLCSVLIDRLADQNLLFWKSGVSIPTHVGNVQEFILQCTVMGYVTLDKTGS